MESNNRSPHILGTSANLLGFCLIVLTSIKISKFSASTIIDEVTGVASMCLMISCLLSFLSMKTIAQKRKAKLEYIADIVFLLALLCLTVTIILVSFNVFG